MVLSLGYHGQQMYLSQGTVISRRGVDKFYPVLVVLCQSMSRKGTMVVAPSNWPL